MERVGPMLQKEHKLADALFDCEGSEVSAIKSGRAVEYIPTGIPVEAGTGNNGGEGLGLEATKLCGAEMTNRKRVAWAGEIHGHVVHPCFSWGKGASGDDAGVVVTFLF